jgi:uncharacterized protein (UPF0212 family)
MQRLSEQDILRIWEGSVRQHPVEQALTMLSSIFPDFRRNDLLALSVGQRDAYLLTLRERLFGSQFTGYAECSQCGERLEFTFDAANIRVGTAPIEAFGQVLRIEVENYEVHFRLPNSEDLTAIAECRSIAAARNILISRCIAQAFHDGNEIIPVSLPEMVLAGLGKQMLEYDPQAEVNIDLSCPGCGHRWSVVFDVVAFLWVEILAYAKRLLREVHTLARAYGWHEADILAMSAVRRQFYLEMVS